MRGNNIKEGVGDGHIIKDGVVGPGHQANCLAGAWFPFSLLYNAATREAEDSLRNVRRFE